MICLTFGLESPHFYHGKGLMAVLSKQKKKYIFDSYKSKQKPHPPKKKQKNKQNMSNIHNKTIYRSEFIICVQQWA